MQRIFFLLLFLVIANSRAQPPSKLNSAEIHQAIKKLNFLGSVLYIAAHPDDENTRLISYMSNELKARTTYLSITRGDGGQNLIGPQLKEQLGIIRSQELLAARRIDGGEQFFTRAIDFGYTKTPEEAMEFWGKDEVVSDVVWAIRTLKPDVIINRFNHRTSGETHGQHTASALLGVEAFDLAGDPNAFPSQLKNTQIFAPKRLFFNTSPWFYGSDEEFEKADHTNILKFDTGVYFPSKGLSNPEIAALSRSEHQSQGFGSTGSRGEQIEYLELIKGDTLSPNSMLFSGIDTSWNRVKGGAPIGTLLSKIEREYDFRDPSASLPDLLKAYTLIEKLEDDHWRDIKLLEIKAIIAGATGLFMEAVAASPNATIESEMEIRLEVINRSNAQMKLVSVELEPNNSKLEPQVDLKPNTAWKNPAILKIGPKADITSPYWLRKKGTPGLYEVDEQNLIGKPENLKNVKARFLIDIDGTAIPFEFPIIYKYNDAVKGEVYQPFEIVPRVSVSFRDKVLIFDSSNPRQVSVTITAYKDDIEGEISLNAPNEWKIVPEKPQFKILKKGGSVTLNFMVSPPAEQEEAVLFPEIKINGEIYSEEVTNIKYDHIPVQTLVMPAEIKLVKLDIKKKGENIGYIEGAGDVIPESMEQIGYKVTRIDPAGITAGVIQSFDAIVVGIRAYNTVEALKFAQPALLKYVENGGTLIIQYNVNRGILASPLAPYTLNISRDRVTEEDSQVRFPNPDHPILNTPNKITQADFEGWVQERGLYFADSWGPEFIPVLSMNDKNESPKLGSLIVAKHGKGYFIYTGLSFFRQFPEGVPGSFRLFTNMISIGK